MAVIGKIGLTPKGEYSSETVYEILDVVSNDGNSYVSRITENNQPLSNTDAWVLSAEKGGKGDKGDTFTFADLTDDEKEQLKGDVIAYNTLSEADKNNLASRVPVNGVIEQGNTQAVSGGEVFSYIGDNIKYYYPFVNQPITDIWRRASLAVKEFYINNYDDNYTYQILQIARKIDYVGFDPNLYIVKLAKIEIANPSNIVITRFMAYDLDEGSGITIVESNEKDFYALVDWSQLEENTSFDVDPNGMYTISSQVSDYKLSPIIKQNLESDILKPKGGTIKFNQFILNAGENASLTEPEYNLGIGRNSLKSLETGGYNLAVGIGALENHKTGAGNVAVGTQAMQSSESCIDVTMIGWEAGRMMKEGVGDVGVGRRALMNSETAGNNTALGDSTLFELEPNSATGKGYSNVAIGYTTAEFCKTITLSVIIGAGAFKNVVSGDNNTIIGGQAMLSRTTASESNVSIGANNFLYSTAGNYNAVLGTASMTNCNGSENTAFGYNTGNSITTGNNNVILGSSAQSGATNVSNAIVIGATAKATKNNQIVIGNNIHDEVVLCGIIFTKAQIQALKDLIS